MLASVSRQMCTAAEVSLVYSDRHRRSSCRLLSVGPATRGAEPLESTDAEGLGTLRFQVQPFPAEHRCASH